MDGDKTCSNCAHSSMFAFAENREISSICDYRSKSGVPFRVSCMGWCDKWQDKKVDSKVGNTALLNAIRSYAEIDLRCANCDAPLSFLQREDDVVLALPCSTCLDDAMKAGEEKAREEAGK